MVRIAPSILAADFACLGKQVRETEQAGADRVHIDVMDGHFVPNLSMGPAVVGSLRKVTRLPLECHLMVEDPGRFFDSFLHHGADTLVFHYEAAREPLALARRLHDLGKRVGVAIRPDTPVERLEPLLPEIDVALCMTVYPGFAGQSFLPESPARVRQLRHLIDRLNPSCDLEVDGGIGEDTLRAVVEAGANVLVAATAIFRHPEGPADAVRQLLAQANGKAE
ncbi:MAG TPA: ribulose-phosphate 3-epimerase [Gemmataceae bacterium]|nr:ribulose-phosphate 3-epimerase [Gemmataceae bacterium]